MLYQSPHHILHLSDPLPLHVNVKISACAQSEQRMTYTPGTTGFTNTLPPHPDLLTGQHGQASSQTHYSRFPMRLLPHITCIQSRKMLLSNNFLAYVKESNLKLERIGISPKLFAQSFLKPC